MESMKLTKWLIAIWVLLAGIDFVGVFFEASLFFKCAGIIFGIMNSLIILSWGTSLIQAKREYRQLQKDSLKEETPGKE